MKFTNRIIAILLCLVMMSAVACLSVSAKTLFPVGDWVYEKINNNTEFEVDEYTGSSENVFTPYYHNNIPITSIGSHAFTDNTTLKSIEFGPNLTYVQSYAFLNCSNLTTVLFNGDVSLIGEGAFNGCSSLSSINLEDTVVETIPYSAFMNCSSLTQITIPSTVTSINECAFAYCDNLSRINIPATVTAIDGDAFVGSNNIVIYCEKDSLAHRYAVNNSLDFVLFEDIETYLLGDADDDGVITVLDSTLIQFVLAERKEKPDRFDIRSDSDLDGKVSVMDATLLQYYVAGLLVDTSVGNTFEY